MSLSLYPVGRDLDASLSASYGSLVAGFSGFLLVCRTCEFPTGSESHEVDRLSFMQTHLGWGGKWGAVAAAAVFASGPDFSSDSDIVGLGGGVHFRLGAEGGISLRMLFGVCKSWEYRETVPDEIDEGQFGLLIAPTIELPVYVSQRIGVSVRVGVQFVGPDPYFSRLLVEIPIEIANFIVGVGYSAVLGEAEWRALKVRLGWLFAGGERDD